MIGESGSKWFLFLSLLQELEKGKDVWAGLEFLQGKCEALGKTNPSGLSFLPNIGLFWTIAKLKYKIHIQLFQREYMKKTLWSTESIYRKYFVSSFALALSST